MSWEDKVRRVVPYVPGEQPKKRNVIKLNTNEFPYPPSPVLKEALKNTDQESYRLYPDPYGEPLRSAIGECYKVSPERVFVGVGSDDVLSMAFLTFFNSEKPVLFADITYSFYDVWADVYRIPYERIPLNEDYHMVKEDYLRENGGIVIANPNAPTGISEASDPDFFESIVKGNPDSVVIIDEAYVDFSDSSMLCLTEKYDNVLIVQTFSKSRAFAGMRIGFAIGNEKLIKYMNDVKFSVNSYTMSRAAIEYGIAVLKDKDYFEETVKKLINSRERIKKELKELDFEFFDSKANFIFATHKKLKAEYIFKELKKQDIYVRFFNKARIDNYLRITIGRDEDMDRLIIALKDIISKG